MNPWNPPIIRTDRLVIRPFAVEDLEAVHAYARAYPAGVYGSWLGGNGPSEVARYVADTVARYGRPPRLDLGVTMGGKLVGGVAFRQVWISPPALEVGWVIHPAAAGQGVAREAIGALVEHVYEVFPELVRLESRVRLSDAGGIRLLEGLGFEREGTLRYGAGEADAGIFGKLRA